MGNLLNDAKRELENNGKSLNDIKWVGCEAFTIPIENFLKLADIEANEDSYIEEVYTDLLVCGEDWWLERQTYDGNEWWEFKEMPTKPTKQREDIKTLKIVGLNDLLKDVD